jgi:hypothetical protein
MSKEELRPPWALDKGGRFIEAEIDGEEVVVGCGVFFACDACGCVIRVRFCGENRVGETEAEERERGEEENLGGSEVVKRLDEGREEEEREVEREEEERAAGREEAE